MRVAASSIYRLPSKMPYRTAAVVEGAYQPQLVRTYRRLSSHGGETLSCSLQMTTSALVLVAPPRYLVTNLLSVVFLGFAIALFVMEKRKWEQRYSYALKLNSTYAIEAVRGLDERTVRRWGA